MDKKLYLVTILNAAVGQNDRYYVYCTYRQIADWSAMLVETGHGADVVFVEKHLSDFDEINHNHFC